MIEAFTALYLSLQPTDFSSRRRKTYTIVKAKPRAPVKEPELLRIKTIRMTPDYQPVPDFIDLWTLRIGPLP